MPIHAVLTGDIVNSTKLKAETEKKLITALHKIMSPFTFEFYRGDSFQVFIKEPDQALKVALLCRTEAISLVQDENSATYDVKISIGIGPVKMPLKTLGSAKGEAFILSGRSFDDMLKTDTKLSITTESKIANIGLQILADYINAIYKGMTTKQAEVIFQLLQDRAQQQVAVALNKSKSTISQFASASRWPEIEKLLQHFKNLINQLT